MWDKLRKSLMGMTKGEIVSLAGMVLVIANQTLVVMGKSEIPEETANGLMALVGSMAGLWVAGRVLLAGKKRQEEKEGENDHL
ncbi:hypothetical protein [Desmospora activa]|uniref:Uncharacterized protein n=1 Tax=Desmospora activa DSM 45169 TaxID=1121389 RepID=A0A2T4Z914_9BACL|nr:hypothetical protein [Desmospora activa]PTM58391.1 hypothetical protein C8J48_0973 [Desmospora activa DSM 45169]